MHIVFSLILLISCSSAVASLASAENRCKTVRMADVGWTDITATTALAAEVLRSAGYQSKINQISLPITFLGLKNNDIDVFLGDWRPSMDSVARPYQKEGSIESVGTLLKGAKYTLVVPQYVHDAGVRSMTDLAKFSDRFKKKIYAVEPGNDGNGHIQNLIDDHTFGLQGWRMVESSEQAMLAEAMKAVKEKEWIVFLGWEPHPMNRKMPLTYLTGGERYFGPEQGKSTVLITTRKGYAKECPEVVSFLKNFSLNLAIENALMEMILDHGIEPKTAALNWLGVHPDALKKWRASFKVASQVTTRPAQVER